MHGYSNTTECVSYEKKASLGAHCWAPRYLHDPQKHHAQSQLLGDVRQDPRWADLAHPLGHLPSHGAVFTPAWRTQPEPPPFHFTLLVGVSDSVDCRPSVQASRVLFRASVFCWSTTT